MNKLLYLLAPLFLVACGMEDQPLGDNPSHLVYNDNDDVMSEGSGTHFGTRYMYEYNRLKNPHTGTIPGGIRAKELEFAKTLPVNYYRNISWEHRGPYNVGGRTRTIGIDVLDENHMLAAGVSGGIWRTTDAGLNWEKVTAQDQLHSITSIVQDTRTGHESTWYAGTGEHYAIVSQVTFEARFSGNGIMKSTDNGLTWEFLDSTMSNTPTTWVQNGDMDFVWRMVIDPTDMVNDVVLAAVFNGIYRSEDGGDTWDQVFGFSTSGIQNPGSDYLDLVVTPSGVFYCTISSDGPTSGIFRSEDGINWISITPGTFPSAYGRLAMAVNPLDDDIIWIFGEANTGIANGHGVWRYEYLSGDGSGAGGSWQDRSDGLPVSSCLVNGITTDIGKLNTQSSFDVHIGIHPTDTNIVYIAGTSIWRNTDGFTHDSTNTWIGGYACNPLPYNDINWNLSYPNHHPDQHYITWLPSDPDVMINVNDGGIYKTLDATADSVNWVPLNNGYVTTQFYALAIEPGEATSDIVIGGLQDNGTWWTNSTTFEDDWKYIGSGDGMYCALTNGAEYYVTSKQRGKLYLKQIDANGNVIDHERIDPTGGPNTYEWCNRFILDPSNDKRIFLNGQQYLWRLDDLTDIDITGDRTNKEPDHWEQMIHSKGSNQMGAISDIEMCPSDPNTVWYGTDKGWMYRIEEAYEENGDCYAINVTGDDWPAYSYLSSIGINPYNSSEIVVTFANYGIPSIWHTSNGGADWTDISGNLEENPDGSGNGPAVFWCEYYVDGTIFVGTSIGLFTTNNLDGANTVWTMEPSIGNVPVDHMDFRTHDGYFAVATHGQGIFTTHLPVGYAGIEEQAQEYQVYPTLVEDIVNVVADEPSQIFVFDLDGSLILQKVGQVGTTKVDMSSVAAGTYVVAVVSTTGQETQKIVKQ